MSDIGTVLMYGAALVAIAGGIGTYLKRSLSRVVDARIAPLGERLTQHLNEETEQMNRVAASLEILAASTGTKIPPSLKV